MDLSDFFTTKSQASDFSARLAAISASIYKTDFDLGKALLDAFGIQKRDMFMKLLRDSNITVESHTALKEFFEKTQQTIAALPVLSMSVAFEPQEQTLKALSDWFVLNIKKQVLFEITVDPNLLAGATITFNGKFADYSIKPTFEKILQDMMTTKPQAPIQETQKPNHISIGHFHLGR